MNPKPKKLLDRVRETIRLKKYSDKTEQTSVRIFMIGDGVNCATANQTTPNDYYNIERMLKPVARRGEVAT